MRCVSNVFLYEPISDLETSIPKTNKPSISIFNDIHCLSQWTFYSNTTSLEGDTMAFILPTKCLRKTSCRPLAQLVSDTNKKDFFCCGKNHYKTRTFQQDKYNLCYHTDHCDEITQNDKRDLIHSAYVIMKALAIIEEIGE